jgi:hypothetical protein
VPALLSTSASELSLLVERLRLLTEQVEKTEDVLVRLVNSIEESQYLLSIISLSYMSVAGILAGLGSLRAYRNAKQLIKMAGSNHIEWESAGKRVVAPLWQKGTSRLVMVYMDCRHASSQA